MELLKVGKWRSNVIEWWGNRIYEGPGLILLEWVGLHWLSRNLGTSAARTEGLFYTVSKCPSISHLKRVDVKDDMVKHDLQQNKL